MNTDQHPVVRRHRQRGQAGFTLVEAMLGLCISGFLLAGIVVTYVFSLKGYQAATNYRIIHGDGRHAVDYFAKDIRAVSAITTLTTNRLVVTIPTAFSTSGAITSSKTVTYDYRNGAFYRTDSSTTNTSMLATNIYALTISLFDHIGNPTTLISSAKGIQLDIKLRKRVISQIQSEDYLSARLDMRNK